MTKGGDQTTQSTTSSLPDYVQPYYTDLLSRAKTVSEQPYTTYKDPRLADFSADTNTAFGQIENQAATGGGTGAVDSGIAGALNVAGYKANTIPGADLSQYINPYTTNVLDVQKQRANQDYQEQQASRDASAVNAGAFGGDRRFVADSLAQRDLNTQLQGIDATGLQAAYDRATGLYQTDEQNRQGAAGLNLNASQLLGTLGQTKNDIGLQNAEALSSVGAKQQQRTQAGLDLAYQDFQNQQNWPSQQLSLYSQLLSGTPVSAQATTTTTQPAPDFLSQLLGLGTSAAGLAGLLGG